MFEHFAANNPGPRSPQVPPGTAWYVALGCITLLGLAFRGYGIDVHSFWYDEAVTADLAQAPTLDLLSGKARDNGNPPFYWIAAGYVTHLCGASDVALRSLSVLCGTLTIPLLALLGLRLFGAATGLTAAGLLAVSPFALELSTEARCYALLQFLAVANMLLFLRWTSNRNKVGLAMYGVTLGLCCLTHYYALALPVVQGAALLWMRRERKYLLPWSVTVAVAALVCCAWLPSFLAQIGTSGNLSRGGDAWHFQFLATPLVFALGRTFAWRTSPLPTLALATAAALLCFWCLAASGVWAIRRQRFDAFVLGAWLLLPIVGPLAVAVTLSPVYAVRYASLSLPVFVLLVACGLERLALPQRVLASTALLVLTAFSIRGFFSQPLKDDWRAASLAISDRADSTEPIVFDTDAEVVSFRHYASRFGTVQRQMWGLTDGLRDGALRGVAFKYGRREDDRKHDYTTQIVSVPSLWLAACVSQASPRDYTEFFAQHGYRLVENLHFHRIDVLHFVKSDTVPELSFRSSPVGRTSSPSLPIESNAP